jgi:hypothetical protein
VFRNSNLTRKPQLGKGELKESSLGVGSAGVKAYGSETRALSTVGSLGVLWGPVAIAGIRFQISGPESSESEGERERESEGERERRRAGRRARPSSPW